MRRADDRPTFVSLPDPIPVPDPSVDAPLDDAWLVRFEGRAMASPLRLTVVVTDRRPAEAAIASEAWLGVRDEFDACDQAMSRFSPTSEITRLNRAAGTGRMRAASWRLRHALAACDRAHRVTGGRFDPRVLRDLERLGDRGARLRRVGGTVRGVDPARLDGPVLRLDRDDHVGLDEPVDLGGIGKGLALRWAAAGIGRLGVQRFLLDAGGDIVVRGAPPEGGPWLIGLEDPSGRPEPLAVVAAEGGAVATSSILRRRWSADGQTVHHLIDPRTGRPGGAELQAVTVAGPDPAWAEVWSKALFLSGRRRIAAVARLRGLAAWWVTDDGSLEMTPVARQRTQWVAGE